jgi:integrative and conjugative element protein (TIGR02256 family)
MPEVYLPVAGEVITRGALAVRRASQLYRALVDGDSPYARFIKAVRVGPEAEAVVLDVEAEVGQSPIHDIRRCERLAIICRAADDSYPETLALRPDFPAVPHINLNRHADLPRSLCLYDEPWSEVRLRWTAPSYIERIRGWLALTAEGTLHAQDQPLEPILAGASGHLVLPTDLFVGNTGERPERLNIFRVSDNPADNVFIALRAGAIQPNQPLFAATLLYANPQQHGVIRRVPNNLADLHDLMVEAGLDLRGALCERLLAWQLDKQLKASALFIIVFLPKMRSHQGSVEATDLCAFITGKSIEELGQSLGIWDTTGGQLGTIIGGGHGRADDIQIDMLDPMFALSRPLAARYNGLVSSETRITAIGAGALGSQVITKLIRAGFGRWKLIDRDFVLPHNIARHELTSPVVGCRKASALALWANSILEEPDVVTPIIADVLQPGNQAEPVSAALADAEIIADFSASVAVARRLATDRNVKGRRVSLFLSPSGADLVVLAEDRERSSPLDFLEMLYYRAVAMMPELAGHMHRDEGPVRYARSCRDVTSTVSEELVGLHSAIGSRALRIAAANGLAAISVWQADQDLQIRRTKVPVTRPVVVDFGEWLLYTDSVLQDKIQEFRAARLPNETGGVLLGHIDCERHIVYVVDALPSPPDSKEWPTVYIRGAVGLRARVEDVQRKTATMLHYVGEWHSHPDGYSCRPSGEDKRAFAWLVDRMAVEDFPAIMLIAGKQERAWYLGEML